MKQLFTQYAAYNLWANKILLEKLAHVSDGILHKDMGDSFGSIYKTIFHLRRAESIWWQRLKLQEHIQYPEIDVDENVSELSKHWLEISKQWSDWAKETNEKNIMHVFGYYDSKKEYFKQPVYEMLLHLFNHATFHRGQIITMLRQNGIDKIPALDFIVFSRSRAFNALKSK